MSLVAFVDESESRQDLDAGTYILCATIVEEADVPVLRERMMALKPASRKKLHWRDETSSADRRRLVECVSELGVVHLVVIRLGGVDARSERRRRLCLERLGFELNALGVVHAVFESRGRADDKRDLDLLRTLRARRVIGGSLRFDHLPGPAEPMLWIADVVCGAVTQDRIGNSGLLDLLRRSITLHEVHGG